MTAENRDWAIDVAADFLRRRGYLIVDTSRVCHVPGRGVGIPLVAWDGQADAMAFVNVRTPTTVGWRNPTHKQRTAVRSAVRMWARRNKWRGETRFDVIDIYGSPDKGRPVIDHVTNVGME